MKRLHKQAKIGIRWLNCGWRLFRRNPWLLLGMGLTSMLVIVILVSIPFVGSLVIAFLAPILMSGAVLAADELSRQKMALPASLRAAAFMRSPKVLVSVVGKSEHVATVLVMGMYTLAVALAINIAAYAISGGAWVNNLLSLDTEMMLRVLGTWLVVLMLYLVLTMSLIYSIPLIFLQGTPIVPALARSLQAGWRHLAGLIVVVGVAFIPFALGVIASPFSTIAMYTIWFLGGAIALPLFITSSYCSYRTVVPPE